MSVGALAALAVGFACAGAWIAAPGHEPIHSFSAEHPAVMLLGQFAFLGGAVLWRRLRIALLALFWLLSGLTIAPALSYLSASYGTMAAVGILALSAVLGLWLYTSVQARP